MTDHPTIESRLLWHRWRKDANEQALASNTLTPVARIAAKRTVMDATKQIAALERLRAAGS
jgi:hypothetical protein